MDADMDFAVFKKMYEPRIKKRRTFYTREKRLVADIKNHPDIKKMKMYSIGLRLPSTRSFEFQVGSRFIGRYHEGKIMSFGGDTNYTTGDFASSVKEYKIQT